MKNDSKISVDSSYCHPISVENYFMSPKMPIKDHTVAFRSTKASFKPDQSLVSNVYFSLIQKSRVILEKMDVNKTI